MGNLWVQESWLEVRGEKRLGIGDSDVYESGMETPGEIYKYAMKEYGRCTSKVYIDTKGKPKHIGWVFLKRTRYQDSKDTYLQETWITVHDGPPIKTIEYKYHEVSHGKSR